MKTLILYSSLSCVFRSGVPQPGANRRPPSGMMWGRIPTGGRPPFRMPTGEGPGRAERDLYICCIELVISYDLWVRMCMHVGGTFSSCDGNLTYNRSIVL